MTCSELVPVMPGELRLVLLADWELRPGAPRMEAAPARRVDRRRDVALEDDSLLLSGQIGIRDRHRREQGPRVRMLGVLVQSLARCDLGDLAEIHDRDPVA